MAAITKRKQTNSLTYHNIKRKVLSAKRCVHDVNIVELFKDIIFNPSSIWIVAGILLCAEILVNLLVIQHVKYTEIDWRAYMQEVEGVVNGTYDYSKLEGETGPLVYPAGFVFIFGALYYITGHGINIRLAQYIFMGLYLLTLIIVIAIYRKSEKVPPYTLFFMCCASYRIHSIYVLRLFNDPVAMVLLYLAVLLFVRNHWTAGCILYSLAVSVKMNILLFAPALLLLLLANHGITGAVLHITVCGMLQVILALPFLLTNPLAYIARSFNMGRQFFYEWTVNWRCISEELFLNRFFHLSLLLLHLAVLIVFAVRHWVRRLGGWKTLLQFQASTRMLSTNDIVLPLFTANLIGVAFSRSLHYQFYVWYFHTLPYLLWSTRLSTVVRICLLGVIELAWNTFPSTVMSSISLHLCHAVIIVALYWGTRELQVKCTNCGVLHTVEEKQKQS